MPSAELLILPQFAETTLRDFLARVASKTPAPGGGSVAAVTAAQGAALVSMVANLTLGRPKYAAHDHETAAVLAEAERVRGACLRAVDEDAAVLAALMSTYKLPRSTVEQGQAREERLQAALLAAALVPHSVAGYAAAIVALCQRLLPIGNTTARSDVAVAALCASAAFGAAELNVLTNAEQLTDRERARALLGELDGWRAAIEKDVAVLVTAVRVGFS